MNPACPLTELSSSVAASVGCRRPARSGAGRFQAFKYRDLGSAATIGRFRSVVDFRGHRFSGFPAWVVWGFVHLTFLTGFGNRVTTLLTWTRSFIGRGRVEREFSVMHTGGDLSLPADVRAIVQPKPLPRLQPETRLGADCPTTCGSDDNR